MLDGETDLEPSRHQEVVQIKCVRARVTATYANRISSRILILSTHSDAKALIALLASLFLVMPSSVKYGSSWASPRRANGTCFSFFNQLSGSLLLTPGKVPSDNPGTATTSHSAPFAM